MSIHKSEATQQAEFVAAAEQMYVRLRTWRAVHLDATFDAIGVQVTQERKALMAQLLGELATQPEEVTTDARPRCPHCGEVLTPKGKRRRQVSHLEGEVQLEREYGYCDHCHSGLFPPGQQAGVDGAQLESADD
jgi:uncharacterized protein with PIN domain